MGAIGHEVYIMRSLILGRPGLVPYLEAAEPFDPGNTLHPRHYQSQGITIFGAKHFTVLAIGHHGVVKGILEINRPSHARTIGTFG